MIDELNEEVKAVSSERDTLRTELKEAEEKVLSLKSAEIKWRANNESKLSELTGSNESAMERYRQNISDIPTNHDVYSQVIRTFANVPAYCCFFLLKSSFTNIKSDHH